MPAKREHVPIYAECCVLASAEHVKGFKGKKHAKHLVGSLILFYDHILLDYRIFWGGDGDLIVERQPSRGWKVTCNSKGA